MVVTTETIRTWKWWSLHTSQVAHQTGAYHGFMKRLGIFLLPLDRMLVYRMVTPCIKFAGTHLYWYLGWERHCESRVSCPRMQHSVPGQGSNSHHTIRSLLPPHLSHEVIGVVLVLRHSIENAFRMVFSFLSYNLLLWPFPTLTGSQTRIATLEKWRADENKKRFSCIYKEISGLSYMVSHRYKFIERL